MYSQKTKTGKVRFFESYVDPITRLRKTASVTLDKDTTKSRKQAQALLYARISSLTAQAVNPSNLTLSALVEAYMDAQRDYIKPQSLDRNLATLYRLIDLLPYGVMADAVTAPMISAAISQYSNTMRNGYLKRVRILYRWAYKNGYVTNIDWLVRLQNYPDNAKERRNQKYLERDELLAVVAAADDKYKDAIMVMALSGLRLGELCALTKEDITDVINVNKSYSPNYGIGATKTDGSTREVYIQKELAPYLQGEALDRVLSVGYQGLFKHFRQVTADVLGRPLTTHALRHTHVSLLAAAGVPLDMISRRCGHTNSKITTEIYLHVTKMMKDRDKAVLDSLKLI